MRAVFLGTPAAAVPSLAAASGIADISLVITRPDASQGRSGKLVAPAVKDAAEEWGFPVAQPQTAEELRLTVGATEPDIAIVVAYGRILSADTLAAVPMGFVNVHFSLLPRWRGAAPVERAILEGDSRTGVSLMVLDEGMDTGPLLGAIETEIGEDETGGSLTARLAQLGAELLESVIPEFARGRIRPVAQMAAGATNAPRLTTAEARITADIDAATARRMVRAYAPRPGAWAVIDGSRTKIWSVTASQAEAPAGHIEIIGGLPVLGLESGAVTLEALQPHGKRLLSGREWANGRRGAPAQLTEA